MNRNELIQYAKSSNVFYGLDLSRISSVLIAQIFHFERTRTLNVHNIGDELKRIESNNSNKSSIFKHLPLKGLHKTHFFDACFILGNMNAEFGFDKGGNKKLDNIIDEAFQRNNSGFVDDKMVMFLAHEMTVAAFEKRALQKKLSGEWIIYHVYENQYYYLTLASHRENDNLIYERVKTAYKLNFPFLEN